MIVDVVSLCVEPSAVRDLARIASSQVLAQLDAYKNTSDCASPILLSMYLSIEKNLFYFESLLPPSTVSIASEADHPRELDQYKTT